MAQIFSGFICGYAVALVSTPLLAVGLLRLRGESPFFARLLPEGTSAVALAVVLHGALFLFWTLAGMVLGAVLFGMRAQGGGLGSTNAPFSLFVLGATLALIGPVIVIARSLRREAAAYALVILLVFGGLLPYMAGWSKL